MAGHSSPSRDATSPPQKEATMTDLPSTPAAIDESEKGGRSPSKSNIRELQHSSHHSNHRRHSSGRSKQSSRERSKSKRSPEHSPQHKPRRKSGASRLSTSRSPHDEDLSLSPTKSPTRRRSSGRRSGRSSRSRGHSTDGGSALSRSRKSNDSGRRSSRPKRRHYSTDDAPRTDRLSSSDRISSQSSHGRRHSGTDGMSRHSPQSGRRTLLRRKSSDAKLGTLQGTSNLSPTRSRRSGGRRHSSDKSPAKKNAGAIGSITPIDLLTESEEDTDLRTMQPDGGDNGKNGEPTKKRSSSRHRHRRSGTRSPREKDKETISSVGPIAVPLTGGDDETDVNIEPRPQEDNGSPAKKRSSSRHRRSNNKSTSPNNRKSIASAGSMDVFTESDNESANSDRAVEPEVQNFVIGTPKRRSNRSHRQSRNKPTRKNSTDTMSSIDSLPLSADNDDDSIRAINPLVTPKSSRRSGPKKIKKLVLSPAPTVSTNTTTTTASTLYGADADAKAKAKAKGFAPASKPGVQQMYSPSNASVAATNMTTATTSTLYGNDADAKAKAKASVGSSKYSNKPGVVTVSTAASDKSSAVDTLYGKNSDADAKAKAKAARGGAMFAANPGVQSIALPATMAPMSADANVDMDSGKDGDAPIARALSRSDTDSESGTTFGSESNPNGQNGASADDGKQKEGEEEEPKKKRRRGLIGFWFCLASLVLIGAGVAVWFFVFREDSGSSVRASGIQDPSTAPSSQPTSMSGPTLADISEAPSSPPTAVELLFQPPSEDNCEAIANNSTIAGRDELDNADFGLALEVVLLENSTMTRPLVEELLDAIQEKILPSIAGCNIRADEFVAAWRFVILDAFVTGNSKPEETCTNTDLVGLNCHRVNVQLDVFLQGFVRFLDIIRLISDEEVNIANNLGLPDVFSIIQLVSINSLTPTASPSSMPSDVPSVAPSEVPTVEASANPTSRPTIKVTGVPTRVPTKDPTSRPTTLEPISRPTVFPTSVPHSEPTSSPSVRPSEVPSESPTLMPTAKGATRAPTRTPSFSPSASPSTSAAPTLSIPVPTPLPSRGPTAAPVQAPTGSPSTRPSTAPVTFPTPPPTTPLPTESPSTGPSTSPVTFPTPPPTTPLPSARPTSFPSEAPSPSPSIMVSNSPTPSPSASPSKNPTKRPTSAPSKRPSAPPTPKPSASPSASSSSPPSIAVANDAFAVIEEGTRCTPRRPADILSLNEISTVEECYNLCLAVAGCTSFTFGIGEPMNCASCGGGAIFFPYSRFDVYEVVS